MKSFNMLKSSPIDPTGGEDRYFIDGKRVTQDEYRKLTDQAKRHDSFTTHKLGGRWQHFSVIYV